MILDQIRQHAKDRRARLVFPDALDVRTVAAAVHLQRDRICTPILVGSSDEIAFMAESAGLDIDEIAILDPESVLTESQAYYMKRREGKGLTSADAEEICRQPLYAAAWAVATDLADGGVAGSLSTTSDVLRSGIQMIGTAEGVSTVSSFFLMIWQDKDHALTFTDCGVVPDPSSDQLVDIAASAALNHRSLTGTEPRVAFLSFSTKGSADHILVDKVRVASERFASQHPDICSDGELQGDAAIVPSVAHRKSPGSPIAGMANVLVFPDLNAGNIAYKLVQRLAGASAFGPIIQGLRKPFCDLSRGCTAEDIQDVAAITAIMAQPHTD